MLAGNEETKPTSMVVQLTVCDSIMVCIQRTALSTSDGDVGRERASGKSWNAQSDVRAVQSTNERREIKKRGQATMKVRACVARVHPHGCDRRMRGKLAKQAQGEKQIEKKRGEMEKNREDTNTKGVEFERSCVGGKRSNQTHDHGCSTYNL